MPWSQVDVLYKQIKTGYSTNPQINALAAYWVNNPSMHVIIDSSMTASEQSSGDPTIMNATNSSNDTDSQSNITDPAAFGLALSAATAGKPWAEINVIFAEVKSGQTSDPTLAKLSQFYQANPSMRTAIDSSMAASETEGEGEDEAAGGSYVVFTKNVTWNFTNATWNVTVNVTNATGEDENATR
jgi:hypothetical protein